MEHGHRDANTGKRQRQEREEKERLAAEGSSRELEIRELWKPHLVTVDLFNGLGGK